MRRPPPSRRVFLRDSIALTAAGAGLVACSAPGAQAPAPTTTGTGTAATTVAPADSWAPRPVRAAGLNCLAAQAQEQLLLHTEGGDVSFWAGVRLGGTTPGHEPGTLSATPADYRRWLPMMASLGIRMVRLETIHPPAFYTALHAYNTAHPLAPIYLLQGVTGPTGTLRPSGTLFEDDVVAAMQAEVRDASLAVHGRLRRRSSPTGARGTWSADVSTWTAAWLVNAQIDPRIIARTDASAPQAAPHEGRYFGSTPEATPTEHWLAARLDELATAEAEHGLSVPMAFLNRAATDPLDHPPEPDPLDDLVGLDARHVFATSAWPGGTFASMDAQPYEPLFLFTQPEYREEGDPYRAYLSELRTTFAGLPLLITSFGVSSALGSAGGGPVGRDQGHHTEQDMMSLDADLLRVAKSLELAGGFLIDWHDDWAASTWNTAVRTVPVPEARRVLSHDPLSGYQWTGLLAHDSVRVGDKIVHDSPGDFMSTVVFDHDASWAYFSLYFSGRVTSPVEIGVNLLGEGGLRLPGGSGEPIYDVAVRMVPTMSTAIVYVRSPMDPVRLDGLARGWWPPPDEGGWNTQRVTLNVDYNVPGTTRQVSPAFLPVGNLILGSWWDTEAEDFNSLATWHLARRSPNDPAILRFRLPWSILAFADPSARSVLVPKNFRPTVRAISAMSLTVESSTPGSPVTFPVSWPQWNTAPYDERIKEGASAITTALTDVTRR